jgi:hypothetical protein
MSGRHLDVTVGIARKVGTCERCGLPLVIGTKVAHYPATRSTAHLACHVAKVERLLTHGLHDPKALQ